MRAEDAMLSKPRAGWRVTPNVPDYGAARAAFSWEAERRALAGLPGGAGINIAWETVGRHAAGPRRDHPALRAVDRAGGVREYSYARLDALSSRFANVLRGLGVAPGARVFTLLGRVPSVHVAALGTVRHGSVYCPLFAAYGPEPLHTRLALGRAAVLVTTRALYLRKVEALREALPELRHVLLVDGGDAAPPATRDLGTLMEGASERFEIPPTAAEQPALLHFTSGTTGRPKGAIHVHEAVLAHRSSARMALDLHPEDVFWCTADPGWVTGTSYGIVAPLALGVTLVLDEGEFDAVRWYRLLGEQRVSVWYTSPTAVRMMMRAGAGLARRHPAPALRFIASVGEPLDAGAVRWGCEAFGLPIHDNWWQTETGGIMIANLPAMDIRPGSMGRPLPGIDAAILRRTATGVEEQREPDAVGELALRRGWPSMFRGYLDDEERYRGCFAGPWYLSGDLARRDADGYFWFVGRADDVIKSSGHLIGPFEVESALMAHEAVAEAGVTGKPDAVAGEVVKAFVVLRPGYAPGEDLRRALLAHARRRLGAAVAPREIDFRGRLPKTRSGKILRRLLRARELGLPEGDLSALEQDEAADGIEGGGRR